MLITVDFTSLIAFFDNKLIISFKFKNCGIHSIHKVGITCTCSNNMKMKSSFLFLLSVFLSVQALKSPIVIGMSSDSV